jgi:hypothetical protein
MFARLGLIRGREELPNVQRIVILQKDRAHAQNLVSKVRSVSEAVFITQSLLELRGGSAVSCLLFDLT